MNAKEILNRSRLEYVLEITNHFPSLPAWDPSKTKQHVITSNTESLGDPGADDSPATSVIQSQIVNPNETEA